MQRTRPLQDHPEFFIRQHLACVEFRVENWRIARDGSGRVLRGNGWVWTDALIPLLAAVLWPRITSSRYAFTAFAIAVAFYVHFKCSQVLWESVLAIPSLGLQFETHRGLPNTPLFVSRRFIPLVDLQDVIINEGLRRWNVRYYLAAFRSTPEGGLTIDVAYENILPYFPVLLEVYRGVHSIMFDQEKDEDERDSVNQ